MYSIIVQLLVCLVWVGGGTVGSHGTLLLAATAIPSAFLLPVPGPRPIPIIIPDHKLESVYAVLELVPISSSPPWVYSKLWVHAALDNMAIVGFLERNMAKACKGRVFEWATIYSTGSGHPRKLDSYIRALRSLFHSRSTSWH